MVYDYFAFIFLACFAIANRYDTRSVARLNVDFPFPFPFTDPRSLAWIECTGPARKRQFRVAFDAKRACKITREQTIGKNGASLGYKIRYDCRAYRINGSFRPERFARNNLDEFVSRTRRGPLRKRGRDTRNREQSTSNRSPTAEL